MLHNYIERKGIKLNGNQLNTIQKDEQLSKITGVYSHYTTAVGIVIYCRGTRDIFLTIFNNGNIDIKDGYDGGDLSSYQPL